MNWKATCTQVYPLGDEREHVTDGGWCWCNPRIDLIPCEPWQEPQRLMIHHAADCRELVEEAEFIKAKVEHGE